MMSGVPPSPQHTHSAAEVMTLAFGARAPWEYHLRFL